MDERTCTRCGTTKPVAAFHQIGSAAAFKRACKQCYADYAAERKRRILAGTWRPTRGNYVKPRTTSPTVRDLEWAAGFIEGEGSFYLSLKDASGRVSATQKDPECLSRLQELFGGSIRKRKRGEIHYWNLSGPRSLGLMFTLYSLLSQRRRSQIQHCIDNLRAAGKIDAVLACRGCGQSFERRRTTRKYCSDKCQARHWGDNNRAHLTAYQRRRRQSVAIT